ncbi:MAG: shikimate kinase [Rikenellaceae bacterium]
MIVFLVGYMGCGKSTLGRELAREMGCEFFDTDDIIEKQEGVNISDIFAQKGENSFRDMERKVIETLSEKKNAIVSTGGGLPCFRENMDLMNKIGFTIYIDVPIDILVSRIAKTGAKRPLVAQKSNAEISEFVLKSIAEREPFYAKAKMKVSGRSLRASDIIQMLNIQNY